MKTPGSPDTTTINEIRTERLSRALQKMRKKSSSVCAMLDTTKINLEKFEPPKMSPQKKISSYRLQTQTSSDVEDAQAFFRRRTSSVPLIKEYIIEPSPTTGHRSEKETLDKSGKPAQVVGGFAVCSTLNRFVRHLLHRRDKSYHSKGDYSYHSKSDKSYHPRSDSNSYHSRSDNNSYHPRSDCNSYHSKSDKTPRAKTMTTIFDHTRPKDQCAPLPIRFRSHTNVQPTPALGVRSLSQHNYYQQGSCSKSSSGVSSRCHSPMRFSTMLSLPTSEPVSPGGPLSPMAPENTYTVLIIGSEGVGKGALLEQFLESELIKSPTSQETGVAMVDDNAISTLIVDNEETNLRFIEVNNEKNDLWLSLSASAYIVLYNFDDQDSFYNAVEIVRKLRECSGVIPIVLVSNKETTCCEKRKVAASGDCRPDGRQIAKQNNCKFYEICISETRQRGLDDLLISTVHQIRRHCRHHFRHRQISAKSFDSNLLNTDANSPFDQPHTGFGGSWFHLRTWSAGSNSSSAGSKTSSSLSVVRQKFWNKKKMKNTPEENIGNSCTNLATTTTTSIQNCFKSAFFRRGSQSMDNLAMNRKLMKKVMCK